MVAMLLELMALTGISAVIALCPLTVDGTSGPVYVWMGNSCLLPHACRLAQVVEPSSNRDCHLLLMIGALVTLTSPASFHLRGLRIPCSPHRHGVSPGLGCHHFSVIFSWMPLFLD